MKKNIQLMLILFLLAFSSCVTQKHNQPTRTYNSTGQDTLLMEGRFIHLDSMRVLVIDFSNATEYMTSPEDWTVERNGADFASHKRINDPSGSSNVTSEVSGNVQSQFSDRISIIRVIDKLRSLTDVVVMHSSSAKMEKLQLDSTIKHWNVDLVITLDYICYDFNQEYMASYHTMNKLFYPESTVTEMGYSNKSYNSVVKYTSCWNLMWVNKTDYLNSKREKIIQVGQMPQ